MGLVTAWAKIVPCDYYTAELHLLLSFEFLRRILTGFHDYLNNNGERSHNNCNIHEYHVKSMFFQELDRWI